MSAIPEDARVEVLRGIPHFVFSGRMVEISREDFWDRRVDDYSSPEGLALEGIADPEITVYLSEETPTYAFRIQTGVFGSLEVPVDFGFPSQHIVLDEAWFPISDEPLEAIAKFMDAAGTLPGEPLSKFGLTQLLRLSNSTEVRVTFNNSVSELFASTTAVGSFKHELVVAPWHYQSDGIEWLTSLYSHQIGGILADQMGLGKTLQLLGLISATHRLEGHRTLVVVPNSLRLNWEREIEKFSPSLSVYSHHGPNRLARLDELKRQSTILTTYELLTYDEHNFLRLEFDLAVFDEAHALKSPTSKRRKIAGALNSQRKVLATGTPFENSLTDLWSLADVVQPGILGPKRYFEQLILQDEVKARDLGKDLAPLILRRTLDQVESDIPDSHESVEFFELEEPLVSIYEDLRTRAHPETASTEGWGVATRLRMFLSEPSVFNDVRPGLGQKFDRLCEVLDEIWLYKEKVIVFSPFLESIDRLVETISDRFVDKLVFSVDGRTKADDRFRTVEEFQSRDGFAVLMANPRAAGQGLNIQGANHVIHFSPDWNPALQDQATFRVLRPGQKRKVYIHRFIYSDTIEEVMNDTIADKKNLAIAALTPSESEGSKKSIEKALAISPRRKLP